MKDDTKGIDVVEGNKLIAEFMGIKTAVANDVDGRKYTIDVEKSNRYNEAHLVKYHYSWDWLMPVVKKIKKIHPKEENVFKHHHFWELTIFATIEDVYSGVVNYIKWYNQNPTTP